MGIFKRDLGLFLTLLQFFGYAACAALQRMMHGYKERKIPLITYCGLGFLQVMGFVIGSDKSMRGNNLS